MVENSEVPVPKWDEQKRDKLGFTILLIGFILLVIVILYAVQPLIEIIVTYLKFVMKINLDLLAVVMVVTGLVMIFVGWKIMPSDEDVD